jgi:hypothetical protein
MSSSAPHSINAISLPEPNYHSLSTSIAILSFDHYLQHSNSLKSLLLSLIPHHQKIELSANKEAHIKQSQISHNLLSMLKV